MAAMPEYLAPGVYVEEIDFHPKPIKGVSTSIVRIVGPTLRGAEGNEPLQITSFEEFAEVFGDARDITAASVRAFFDKGGEQLVVYRVGRGDTPTASDYREVFSMIEAEGDESVVFAPAVVELEQNERHAVLQDIRERRERATDN